MGNMRFKVGDRVRIKSLDWYNRYTNGTEVNCGAYPFTSDMKEFCGQERIIANVCQECYVLLGIDDKFVFTDEMIECKVEEEIREVTDKYYWEMLGGKSTKEFNLPEGYQFTDENGNVINAKKIVLEKKKKEYPKTYEECLNILGYNIAHTIPMNHGHNGLLIMKLQRLLIYRDAYWKIAGEEMGLGKPWEPDWKNEEQFKYVIICRRNCVIKDTFTAKDVILAFPTEEMRDAFYENFKELIETVKELL